MSIKKIEFTNALEDRYLSYALSTITHRALPDVRDGLKPVHRRLLFAMYQLRLNNNSGFKFNYTRCELCWRVQIKLTSF